ncbi:MAG: hypothetical protein ACRD3O_17090 [Terriglobia bacterium]
MHSISLSSRSARAAYPGKNDEEALFRKHLEERGVIQRLAPKCIVALDYGYEFKEAWKNGGSAELRDRRFV